MDSNSGNVSSFGQQFSVIFMAAALMQGEEELGPVSRDVLTPKGDLPLCEQRQRMPGLGGGFWEARVGEG